MRRSRCFGDIQIADDVMIASNAVVVKNIETCGAVVVECQQRLLV